jgi:hypothetical protein
MKADFVIEEYELLSNRSDKRGWVPVARTQTKYQAESYVENAYRRTPHGKFRWRRDTDVDRIEFRRFMKDPEFVRYSILYGPEAAVKKWREKECSQ